MFHHSVSRKLFGFTLAVALVLASSVAGYGKGKENPNPGVLPPQSHAFGKTLGEWAATFFSTMVGTPTDQLYLGYPMGRLYGLPTIARVNSVTVPTGVPLFFGIGAWATVPPIDDAAAIALQMGLTQAQIDALSAEELSHITAVWMPKQIFTELSCTIDGRPIEDPYKYWFESPTFQTLFDPSWGGGCPGSEACISGPAAAAGYALILAPLPPGVHDLSYHFIVPGFGPVDITVLVTVGK